MHVVGNAVKHTCVCMWWVLRCQKYLCIHMVGNIPVYAYVESKAVKNTCVYIWWVTYLCIHVVGLTLSNKQGYACGRSNAVKQVYACGRSNAVKQTGVCMC